MLGLIASPSAAPPADPFALFETDAFGSIGDVWGFFDADITAEDGLSDPFADFLADAGLPVERPAPRAAPVMTIAELTTAIRQKTAEQHKGAKPGNGRHALPVGAPGRRKSPPKTGDLFGALETPSKPAALEGSVPKPGGHGPRFPDASAFAQPSPKSSSRPPPARKKKAKQAPAAAVSVSPGTVLRVSPAVPAPALTGSLFDDLSPPTPAVVPQLGDAPQKGVAVGVAPLSDAPVLADSGPSPSPSPVSQDSAQKSSLSDSAVTDPLLSLTEAAVKADSDGLSAVPVAHVQDMADGCGDADHPPVGEVDDSSGLPASDVSATDLPDAPVPEIQAAPPAAQPQQRADVGPSAAPRRPVSSRSRLSVAPPPAGPVSPEGDVVDFVAPIPATRPSPASGWPSNRRDSGSSARQAGHERANAASGRGLSVPAAPVDSPAPKASLPPPVPVAPIPVALEPAADPAVRALESLMPVGVKAPPKLADGDLVEFFSEIGTWWED